MAAEFFTDAQNLAELVSHTPADDQRKFNAYGHFRLEAAFVDRVFIVYKPTGLTKEEKHKDPEIVTTIKVIDFGADYREGCYAVLKEEKFGHELTLTHVPKQLYGFQIYASVPARLTLKWDGRVVGDKVWRSLSFALLIKTRNRSDFYSRGNHYIETPTAFRKLYPSVAGNLPFKF